MNQIYFVGYDGFHRSDFKYDIPKGFNGYLLVFTQTPALFRVNGKLREYPAHTAVLYPPFSEIWYAANGEAYRDDWLHFTSNESFVMKFPQQALPFSVSDPEYCHSLFQLLTWETSGLIGSSRLYQNTGIYTQNRDVHPDHTNSDSNQSHIIISQLLRILFHKLHQDTLIRTMSGHDLELLSLRRQIAANPQFHWSIARMAEQLHLSAGYLQLLYKEKFNTSCMDDVIFFRLSKARDLLTYTPLSIADIAEQCGYNNAEHFCRQFRKDAGITPGQYRKCSIRAELSGNQLC